MYGGGETCVRCEKTVYKVEEIKGPGLKIYHKRCFTCKECSRALTSSNLTDKDGEAFCKHCYGKLYGPKGFGFGNTLSTEVSTPKPDVEKEASTVTTATVLEPVKPAEPLEIDEKQKNGEEALAKVLGTDNCPTCTKTVYFAEKLIGPANAKYHKACFKCIDCRKTLNKTNYLEKKNVVYCKPCHSKNYGPKGYGFGGAMGR